MSAQFAAVVLAGMLMIGGAALQDLPPVTGSHGAFAFPNGAGTELIVRHDVPRPAEFRRAICARRVLPIRFVRSQSAAGVRADRDSPEGFDSLQGTVFEIVGQRARPQDTCFIAADSLLENAVVVPIQAASTPVRCTSSERRRFATVRQRPVKACWSLATTPSDGLIGVAEYDRVGRSALASLIVLTGDRRISIDFPAEYKGDDEDTWRAGDGGAFAPDGFRVPFIIRRGQTYFVAVDWSAEEGNSLSLYESPPQGAPRQLIEDYWYRAPR